MSGLSVAGLVLSVNVMSSRAGVPGTSSRELAGAPSGANRVSTLPRTRPFRRTSVTRPGAVPLLWRYSIVSVPVDVYYPPPEERISHYAPLRDTLRIIAVVLRLILWR